MGVGPGFFSVHLTRPTRQGHPGQPNPEPGQPGKTRSVPFFFHACLVSVNLYAVLRHSSSIRYSIRTCNLVLHVQCVPDRRYVNVLKKWVGPGFFSVHLTRPRLHRLRPALPASTSPPIFSPSAPTPSRRDVQLGFQYDADCDDGGPGSGSARRHVGSMWATGPSSHM